MNNQKKTSRFDDLIDAARSRQQRDQPQSTPDKPTSQSKSTDPAYTRTTIYLPKQVHRQLKAAAASQERQMSDIVTELIEQWLEKKQGEELMTDDQ
ncbi:CopG family transcriptional regulator [Anabaena sp. FACHB-709]|uniref:Helix-turn-helix protein, CopG n=2 Tax=Nostocaceae TaxID=1162 RepID=A0A1Z4KIP4_ANAVA|nr:MULTISPECIES: CopG family transcriptional regulator [Nostocaceae]BAY68848.1 helix-turn-helix protein, CopG [Trichormus variabilis NIES-23]HBW31535.1 CopG family transcriptional regulator [Nostoc sp. UBA8866]MBD2170426.1 CopG family transcriptional regulator [Anabaena cylindrica FACHB-318]MBD2262098.1 CopG family transcriptional regulator [Anabaena sp. FACHB-709]MBD2271758.1 CopG family transcriptional regulator [Nostoc sp. PCC 7120 = FACHB-418]